MLLHKWEVVAAFKINLYYALQNYFHAFHRLRYSAISRELLGAVGLGAQKMSPKKSSNTLPKSLFFIKQIVNFLLCEIYQKLDI